GPHERHRFVVPLAAVVFGREELRQPAVPILRECLHATFRPLQGKVMLLCLLAGFGDLKVSPARGEIALLDRHDRLHVARAARERFHDLSDSKPLAVNCGIAITRPERANARPSFLGEPTINLETLLAEHAGVSVHRAAESIPLSVQLPFEQSSGQYLRIWP